MNTFLPVVDNSSFGTLTGRQTKLHSRYIFMLVFKSYTPASSATNLLNAIFK